MSRLENKEKMLRIIKHKLLSNKNYYREKSYDINENKLNREKYKQKYIALLDILEEIEYQEYKEEILEEDYASMFTYNFTEERELQKLFDVEKKEFKEMNC